MDVGALHSHQHDIKVILFCWNDCVLYAILCDQLESTQTVSDRDPDRHQNLIDYSLGLAPRSLPPKKIIKIRS